MTPFLVTTREAAHLLHVHPSRVRQWAHRRLLRPAGRQGRERLYDLVDVYEAEARLAGQHATSGGDT